MVEVDDEKFIFLTEADVPGRETDGGGREMVLCKEWEVDVVPLVGETFPVGRAIPERMVLPGVVVGLHLPTVRVFEEVGERTLLLFWLRGGGGCAWDDDGGGNCSACCGWVGHASCSGRVDLGRVGVLFWYGGSFEVAGYGGSLLVGVLVKQVAHLHFSEGHWDAVDAYFNSCPKTLRVDAVVCSEFAGSFGNLELKVLHESLLLRGCDTSFPHLDRTPLTV